MTARPLLLGVPVECTLWEVHYRHLKAKTPPKPPEPRARAEPLANPFLAHMKAAFTEEQAHPYVMGRTFVLTADPTGTDLLVVARRTVLGVDSEPLDFSIVQVQRLADSVRGLAQIDSGLALPQGSA